MNIAILMMQKNEDELLKKWVAFHSYLVGSSNLFVYDNGSTNTQVLDQLIDYELNGVNVIREKTQKSDYENRGTIFRDKIQQLDKTNKFDFYLPIDCDEFLGVVDDEGNISFDPLSLKFSLSKLQNVNDVLMIDSQYYNSSISPYWFNKQPYRKCFFKKNTIEHLDQGFHFGKVRNSANELRTNLIHVHFHNKPYEIGKRHAKEKLTGRIDDFNVETLRNYKGSGFHLVRFFLETENQYINGQVALNHIKSKTLSYKFKELGIKWPFYSNLLESRQNLNVEKEDEGFFKVLPTFRGSVDNISIKNSILSVKGWGLVNYSRPVKSVFLKLANGKRYKLNITERLLREDVNNMLNVKGVALGFLAEINFSNLKLDNKDSLGFSIISYLDSVQCFYDFDMHRKFKKLELIPEKTIS